MSWNNARRRATTCGGRAAALGLAALTAACGYPPPLKDQVTAYESYGKGDANNFAAMTGRAMDPERLAALRAAFQAASPDTITFAFDSTAIEPAAEIALEAQARWLRAHPSTMIAIEGHADLVGSAPYNQRLGLRRARAAAARLVELGVAPGQLALVVSRGETRPVIPVEREERVNRRAVSSVEGWGAGWRGRSFDGKRAYLAYEQYSTKEIEAADVAATAG